MKKVIIAGASGMVGSLVLEYCLVEDEISQVYSLVRKSTANDHQKLEEIIVSDFTDLSPHKEAFEGIDIGFFCIGAYTGQVSTDELERITVDMPIVFAAELKTGNPDATLCFLSGQGADRSEKSRFAFARFKGIAENCLSEMGLGAFYSFRPGYIYPVEPRDEPTIFYSLSRKLYPLIRLFGKNTSIKSVGFPVKWTV